MSLTEARIQAGIQVQELADKARVSRTTIYNAENDEIGVNRLNANRIVKALNDLAGTHYSVEELRIVIK